MFKYYKKWAPYLFLLPAVVILLIFFFIPFFQTIGLSFFDYSNNIYNPNFIGIKNYIEIFKNPVFYKVMLNTIIYLIVAVPILAIFPLFLAILINQKIRALTMYKILIYLPVIVSIVVAAIAFKWLYAQDGILYKWAPNGTRQISWWLLGCWINEYNQGQFSRQNPDLRQFSTTIYYDKPVPYETLNFSDWTVDDNQLSNRSGSAYLDVTQKNYLGTQKKSIDNTTTNNELKNYSNWNGSPNA